MSNIETRSSLSNIEQKDNFIIEGYCALFEPYIFYQDDGVTIYEKIERNAFDGADFSDCALKKEHTGDVFARVKNGSLTYKIDSKGVFMRADLSATNKTKELYEEVKAGLYSQMSFAFTIEEQEFDKKSNTQIIKKIKKVYDFSVCHMGANSATNVYARNWLAGAGKPIVQELQARNALVENYLKEVNEAYANITNR